MRRTTRSSPVRGAHGHGQGSGCGHARRRGRAWPLRVRLVALLCSAALAACGNVTAGGVGGADVYMSGDATTEPAPSSGPSRTVLEGPAGTEPRPATLIVGGIEGDVDVTAELFLRSDGGSLVPLTTAGPVAVTLDLAGSDEPRVAVAPVPADGYDAVVVRFTDVTARVTGGLVVDGIPFVGTVDVDLGGTGLAVTRTVALLVEEDVTVELLVDLNADAWVPLLDVLTATVAGGDFAAAVAVSER